MGRVFRGMLVLGAFAAVAKAESWVAIKFEEAPSRNLLVQLGKSLQAEPVIDGVTFQFKLEPYQQREWNGNLIVVNVKGSCKVPGREQPLSREPLGWVNVVDGQWLPFVSVDCTRLAEAVRRSPCGAYGAGDLNMPKVIALVIRHELHHLIRRTREHDDSREFAAALRL